MDHDTVAGAEEFLEKYKEFMENEKLVGLRPYRKEEEDIFYGREKEVEGLLQILQLSLIHI